MSSRSFDECFTSLFEVCRQIQECASSDNNIIWSYQGMVKKYYKDLQASEPKVKSNSKDNLSTVENTFISHFKAVFDQYKDDILKGAGSRKWIKNNISIVPDESNPKCKLPLSVIYKTIDSYATKCEEENTGSVEEVVLPDLFMVELYEIFKFCTSSEKEVKKLQRNIDEIRNQVNELLEEDKKIPKKPSLPALNGLGLDKLMGVVEQVVSKVDPDAKANKGQFAEMSNHLNSIITDPEKSGQLVDFTKNLFEKVVGTMGGMKNGGGLDLNKVVEQTARVFSETQLPDTLLPSSMSSSSSSSASSSSDSSSSSS